MAETVNIADVAAKLSSDIFKHFRWKVHPKRDDNFDCANPEHTSTSGEPKKTHPGDVVFHYDDPYSSNTIFLHTDLKAYKKNTLTYTKLRDALISLAMTIECAKESSSWREKYSVNEDDAHEVRGLLFVHNTDGHESKFKDSLARIDLKKIPISAGATIHYLGPLDIKRLYSIASDISRLKGEDELPKDYSFYYPDLLLARRQGDDNQPATIEALCGPFLIIKHGNVEKAKQGCLIYYNRPGKESDEFVYFLDCLSRYQLLESDQTIRIRMTASDTHQDFRSIFASAKSIYAKAWGFDPSRIEILEAISIDEIASMTTTYNPGQLGWKT
jgi:hypothetical protein